LTISKYYASDEDVFKDWSAAIEMMKRKVPKFSDKRYSCFFKKENGERSV
jgi:hypothetical protein